MTAIRRVGIADDYTEQERHVLLTGVPLTPLSTRFGHPLHGGWRIEEIRAAWAVLSDELLERWQSPEFDYYRDRGPFAERILTQDAEP
jgi:hypothetical protein